MKKIHSKVLKSDISKKILLYLNTLINNKKPYFNVYHLIEEFNNDKENIFLKDWIIYTDKKEEENNFSLIEKTHTTYKKEIRFLFDSYHKKILFDGICFFKKDINKNLEYCYYFYNKHTDINKYMGFSISCLKSDFYAGFTFEFESPLIDSFLHHSNNLKLNINKIGLKTDLENEHFYKTIKMYQFFNKNKDETLKYNIFNSIITNKIDNDYINEIFILHDLKLDDFIDESIGFDILKI